MNWRKWLDDFVIAGKGILLATKEKRFWYGFIPTFLFFGLLMNLLAGGTSKFDLMFALGFPDALGILGKNFIGIFGVGQPFLDWLPIFLISILQGILIGLIVLLWNKKREQNAGNLGSAGIVAGLIALGAGCPTCGTTLLTPLLGAIFSTGGLAVTGTISTIVTILAIVIAFFSLKRLGVETYVTIINERFLAKKKASNAKTTRPNQSKKRQQEKEKNEKSN
ncbi:hypothetical protein IKE98_02225 [Candidatus Saccharibacteria bacterium]|nr:hypothetical protein [Candidatus Saccharibacteria bacterium]